MNLYKIKSQQTFIADGFKSDYPYWYRGTKKEPEGKFRYHWAEALCGKLVEIVNVYDADQGLVDVGINGTIFERVPLWMFEEELDVTRIFKRPITKRFGDSNRDAKYYRGYQFKFPCDLETVTVKQARAVATWILKVSANETR